MRVNYSICILYIVSVRCCSFHGWSLEMIRTFHGHQIDAYAKAEYISFHDYVYKKSGTIF